MIGGAKGIGLGIDLGLVNQYNRTGSQSYIEPEVLDSLVGVWSAYGMTNDSPNRSTIKNKLSNKGGDFVISNAAFKLNSGFGGFVEDFTSWDRIDSSTAEISNDGSKIKCINTTLNVQYLFNSINRDIPSFKVKISNFTKGDITYYYRKEDGIEAFFKITPLSVVNSDKVIELPKSYNTVENGTGGRGGFYSSNINIGVTITQIPSFEGAFVTDGVDDMITSTKTASEMGITNEVTVVSMIHQIRTNGSNINRNNFFCNKGLFWFSNNVINSGKTGIYGYTSINNSVNNIINNILGDKNDYSAVGDKNDITPSQFSVVGYIGSSTGEISYTSSVAWFWTIIANKVLTTDQINQVIAYFNLDRTLNPDILCNTIKQGITNENHAEFGDKLIDFSGNGRDIQLNNLAWDGDSGIGKYNYPNWKVNVTQGNKYARIVYYDSINGTYSADFKGITDLYKSYGLSVEIRVNRANTIDYHSIKEDGIYTVTPPDDTTSIDIRFGGENVYNASCDITITQIPSHAGALCLDGINDFGKVTGMPIYKDYTFIIDREIISIGNTAGIVASKSEDSTDVNKQGAFLFEYLDAPNNISAWSFYKDNGKVANTDFTRGISYQSKYNYNGVELSSGTSLDSDKLWLGIVRDNDSRFANIAVYSLMSFPYSMSEFLIERQLKMYNLGTLYPGMVEFRPIVKSNVKWNIIEIWQGDKSLYRPAVNDNKTGIYLKKNSTIDIYVKPKDADEVTKIVVNGTEYTNLKINSNGFYYVTLPITKSPQKINITIDEYIRYEDIVQPYPSFVKLENLDRTYTYTWGDKLKVGDTIRYNSSVNLLEGAYTLKGQLECNGVYVYDNNQHITVAKEMIFAWTNNPVWSIDNNEPKCILSPRLLRIPNSSYKLLGYIPDISGHGNHGKINNSAYAEGSGVNEDGSYQLDGVDDHITIPTLSSGGKQVLMKVNWNTINSIIYDQRGSGGFAIYCSDYNNPSDSITVPAYKGRNTAGTTYIDGIRNEYIIASQLRNVTHNIVEILDTSYAAGNINPIIGKSYMNSNYGSLALYDFMLFDNISTDDKIKQLNEYVGIEAKVELPPYYWDAYGKTNLDADKATIQQRGVAVGDYDLTNTNFAYDKMSGFGGYEFEKFTDTTKWIETKREDGIEVIEKNDYSFTAKKVGTGQYFWDFKNNSIKTLDRDLTVKAISNNNVYIRWEFKYRTAEKPDIDSAIILLRQAMTPNVPITVTLPYKTQEEQTELGVVEGSAYYLFYFDPSNIPVGDEYTVEMLPLYTNGLVYDGITDYSKNANIPALDDFTAIIKREWLKKQGCPLIKGSKVYEGGNGNALLLEWDKAYNFVFYKRTDIMEGELPDNISFITPTNYNGNVITRGSEQDTNGICIAGDGNAGFANMVFYKLILYPKTIPLLQINFLKNLMERDEIIDLNNPIFIQE